MRFYARAAIALMALTVPASAAFQFFDGSDPADAPPTISAAGIYTDITARATDTALKFYVVNSPLWSDGAEKQRWIVLKPGRKVNYDDSTDLFTYPDSTVFVKNFIMYRVDGDPTSGVMWETRLLVNKNDSLGRNHWYGYSYKWNGAGTDAVLVNTGTGLDTLFMYYPGGLAKPQNYKKWHYPAQAECNICHPVQKQGNNLARGVAGFFPAQLKRPAPLDSTTDQVLWLFEQGVFTGAQPNAAQLQRRWKGLREPIPAGLSEEQRFRVIDSMARSYIAANCSACHGDRGIDIAGAAPSSLNYDWFDFRPRVEYGTEFGAVPGLNLPDSLLELNQTSRYKFIQAVARTGTDTTQGAPWRLTPIDQEEPRLIKAGRPYQSTLLYRQFAARNTPWMDSVEMWRKLETAADPNDWKDWMFVEPWGSAAWRDSLAVHGVPLDSVVSWQEDNYQMPRTATYIPDTTALRVLGEWARYYRTLVRVEGQDSVGVGIHGRIAGARQVGPMPTLQGRLLHVPEGWTGQARMISVSGRSWMLPSAGRRLYVVPAGAPPGVYIFRVGDRTFRTSLLR